MKILFSKKMAFVYGGLSICALIGFLVTMKMVAKFMNLDLPINVMPVTYMVQPLFFVGIVFGGLAVLCRWGMKKTTVNVILVISILLTGMFKIYWIAFQVFSSGDSRQLTNVVIYSEKIRNYNLGHEVVIAQSLCTSNPLLVDVYEGTKIYEQDSASHQKRQVGLDALQPGQVVDINGARYVSDPEFTEFLLATYDPITLDQNYLLGATEITIHKGESAPVKDGDCYGFMSAP
jgi:phage shock protein PspC (stress-responsive transcriptional regulator)